MLSPTEDLMKVAMKSIGDGIIMTDPQGNITFMNSKAEKLLCVTYEEARQNLLMIIFVFTIIELRLLRIVFLSMFLKPINQGGFHENTGF